MKHYQIETQSGLLPLLATQYQLCHDCYGVCTVTLEINLAPIGG